MRAIVAASENMVIGNAGVIPWSVPEDMKFFKERTTGFPIIMGRKTYESLPAPLKERENIILTRNKGYVPRGWETSGTTVSVFGSVGSVLNHLGERRDMAWVIGGLEIYNLFWDEIKVFYVSYIKGNYPGDTYFPIDKLARDFTPMQELQLSDRVIVSSYTKSSLISSI